MSDRPRSKLFLSANGFQLDCARLARKVFDDTWQPQLILALWRGGAQPGVIMSEVFSFLGRPVAHSVVKCSSYNGIMDRTARVTFECAEAILEAIEPNQRVLVVDDVFDSGKTAEAVRQRLIKADLRTAMVYWKPIASQVDFAPDYYLHQTDAWIVFPHELAGLSTAELSEKDPELSAILLG
ncbi:MAG: phosphoribosyltransferase family protein [Kiritimatiellia bacterium]